MAKNWSKNKTINEEIVEKIQNADYIGVTEFYAPDVLLDMNLPEWRFQKQGAGEVREYLVEQLSSLGDLRNTYIRQWASGENLVLENEARFSRDGEEYLWRAVDIFRLADDQIVEHIQYCTGWWTPEQIARQAEEAPMVRW
jgi:ketosteroid isomerase-like protein